MSLILGLGIPFVFYGLFESSAIWNFSLLIITGTFLTLIFTALAFNIALSNENKIKGFGYAILLWLFLAIIYDGLFLMTLVMFEDYPLDKLSLVGTMLNPIDLSRTLILLKLDISALLGYTGAVFKQFFGTNRNSHHLCWGRVPIYLAQRGGVLTRGRGYGFILAI